MKCTRVTIKSKCPSCNHVYENGIKNFRYDDKRNIFFKDIVCLVCDAGFGVIIHLDEFKGE